MNKVILLGRLTKEPDIRYTQTNNTKVASFTLAVNRRFVKEGEERQADFVNIIAFMKLADFVEKFVTKGLQICLCGRIQTRSWDDENGQRHYATEVIAEEIYFADRPKKADESVLWNNPNNQENTEQVITGGDYATDPDDLPF